MSKACCVALLCAAVFATAALADTPTYSKDVAAILNARCVSCHRPGEIGPMPLTSYSQVRPFAKAIRDAVAEDKMPPWHADPHYGKFYNDRRLTDAQKRTLLQWVNAGAPEGDPKDLPAAPKFVEGWTIPKPDMVITIPKPFHVPAEGVVDYQYMTAETVFTEDKWVVAAEVRPGNRAVVHHVIAFLLPPERAQKRYPAKEAGNNSRLHTELGDFCAGAEQTEEQQRLHDERVKNGTEPKREGNFLTGWAPGMQGEIMPAGAARMIPKGSRVQFQLHYTTNGKEETDSDTKIGLVFTDKEPKLIYATLPIPNVQIDIPAEDGNYEAKSCLTLAKDVTLVEFMPHMHLRGKDFKYQVTYPDGRTETLLSVPKYDFSWQTQYRLAEPVKLPAGARLDCTAHFDNSVRNKYNPDPSKEVKWGDQTFEEMMIGFIDIAIDRDALKPARPAPVSAESSNEK